MDIQKVKTYVKLNKFFEQYCGMKYVGYVKHKVRGKDSANHDLDFTDEEKRRIRRGFNKMVKDMKEFLK